MVGVVILVARNKRSSTILESDRQQVLLLTLGPIHQIHGFTENVFHVCHNWFRRRRNIRLLGDLEAGFDRVTDGASWTTSSNMNLTKVCRRLEARKTSGLSQGLLDVRLTFRHDVVKV